jgi:hypothetical protein
MGRARAADEGRGERSDAPGRRTPEPFSAGNAERCERKDGRSGTEPSRSRTGVSPAGRSDARRGEATRGAVQFGLGRGAGVE